MTSKQRLVFFGLIVVGLAADLWTKAWAFEALPDGPFGRTDLTVIDGFFYITNVLNPGAMWGMAQSVPAEAWIVLRGLISIGLLTFVLRQKQLSSWLVVAFGLILSGALGNLYDNIFAPHGHVRDFVLWVFWGWKFPAFNVADSCISVGATILFFFFALADLKAWRTRRAERRSARTAQSES